MEPRRLGQFRIGYLNGVLGLEDQLIGLFQICLRVGLIQIRFQFALGESRDLVVDDLARGYRLICDT